MKSQVNLQNNNNKRNIKRAAKISYLLKINGFKQIDIANDLKISTVAVSRSFYGLSKISKVDNWLKEKLGI